MALGSHGRPGEVGDGARRDGAPVYDLEGTRIAEWGEGKVVAARKVFVYGGEPCCPTANQGAVQAQVVSEASSTLLRREVLAGSCAWRGRGLTRCGRLGSRLVETGVGGTGCCQPALLIV